MQLIVCAAIVLLLCLFVCVKICVFVSKLLIELSSTDERTEDPLFQPDARKVPGIKGVSITVLNNLVLMSFIA